MSKRVYELAKELGVESKKIIERLKQAGIPVRDHLSTLDRDAEQKARELMAIPAEGEVQTRRVGGGKVVRRRRVTRPPQPRAGATAGERQAQAPVSAGHPTIPQESRPQAMEQESVPAPTTEIAAASEETMPEPRPEERMVPERAVEQGAGEPRPVQGDEAPVVKPEAASEPEMGGQATRSTEEVDIETAAGRKETETASQPKPEAAEKPSKGKKKPGVDLELDKTEKKAKGGRRLVHDRRRDVIRLREYMVVTDEEPERRYPRPARRRRRHAHKAKRQQLVQQTVPKEQKRVIRVQADSIQVSELAKHLSVRGTEMVEKLVSLGVMASVTHAIDLDTAAIVAADYGYTIEKRTFDPTEYLRDVEDKAEDLVPRPPVVTVMGHVDHGKTTLLDRIRRTSVAASEAGGITQHIGAYRVSIEAGEITFVDTPGHEAFTAMRARGAQVTDIVVLVVAADDGVMAQTLEAISHARESGVPIIVAVNKIDKPGASPERVRRELAKEGLMPEEWGGDTLFCDVSAKTGEGVENLLEMIVLQAQMMELKANPNRAARGVVLEARLDNKLGALVTVIVQKGTLHVGDVCIVGRHFARIRRMMDDQGRTVRSVLPSMPVQLAGLDGVPNAGDVLVALDDERKAREIAEYFKEQARSARPAALSSPRVSLEDFFKMAQTGEVKDLKLILRTDVRGTLEAVKEALGKLSHPEVAVSVIFSGVGNVTEGDVHLAAASSAVIIGFNVGVDPKARSLAEQENTDIRIYSVIYDLIDDVKKAMEGMLAPKKVLKLAGRAEVRQVFKISKVGQVAGVLVIWGKAFRDAMVKVVRRKEVVFEGSVTSLKHYQDDVNEVKQGLECGVGIQGFENFAEGDILEFYQEEEVRETIQVSS